MEAVVGEENRAKALQAVKRNHGAPGIDHMKTTELESHLQRGSDVNGRLLPRRVSTRIYRRKHPCPDRKGRAISLIPYPRSS